MELLFKQAGITLVVWTQQESLLSARNKLNKTLALRAEIQKVEYFNKSLVKFGAFESPYCLADRKSVV